MLKSKKYIHYCWFGSKELEREVVCCMQSWQKHFPEYEIMLWNEKNFDINKTLYTKEAYEHKKYAFVTDYVRLYALYNLGGIYFDTDYEVIRPFQDLITDDLLLGFEIPDKPLTAMMASSSGHKLIKEMLEEYENIHFIRPDGSYDETTNVERLKKYLIRRGILLNNMYQKANDFRIYPTEYFSPLNFDTGELTVNENTRGIHAYSGSWLSPEQELYFNTKRRKGRQIAKKQLAEYKESRIKGKTELQYSIIITFYNNICVLDACLKKLLHTLNGREDFEIIVVNDNPDMDLVHILSSNKMFSSIHAVNLEKNLGYSGACNFGASMARGDIYIFIDSDIIVSDMWLVQMEKTAARYPGYGAISANTLNLSTSRIEYFGMYLYEVDSIKPRYNFANNTNFTKSDRCFPIVTSGCMMIEKKNFDALNGFDEQLYNSHCDLDLSLRLAPLKNYVSAKAVVYHRGSASGAIRHISYVKARSLFFKKWSSLEMNQLTLDVLKEMYGEFKGFLSTRYFIIINFSFSTFSNIYINTLINALDITVVQQYDIKNLSQDNIIIPDSVPWDMAGASMPIIYFCDQYGYLCNNFAWFDNRKFKRDLIADMNGNILPIFKLND